jgi:hypothetical protein
MNGRVAVTFPATPKHEQQTVEAKVGKVSFDSYKVKSDGVFWNLVITHYPPSVVAGNQDPMAFLQTRAEDNEKQKAGATRDRFKEIGESEYWAAEHRYTYPGETNSQGGKYESGFPLHRYYLIDTSILSVIVALDDAVYNSRSQAIDVSIEQFFSSLMIRDE